MESTSWKVPGWYLPKSGFTWLVSPPTLVSGISRQDTPTGRSRKVFGLLGNPMFGSLEVFAFEPKRNAVRAGCAEAGAVERG